MSTAKKAVTVRDLVDEAKKRIVVLSICVVGLSYLMSLTSSSVWVNLPAAAFLIIILRYFSLDFDMRRKAVSYTSKPSLANGFSQKKPLENPKVLSEKSNWKSKVNSPIVEDAIDQFTKHLVSEWVTDLWYARITPDRQGPEELVQIINGVLGEFSYRLRNINLIDLLTRDSIHLLCTNLEIFRAGQAKIEKQRLESMTLEERDIGLKAVLASENKLHPALFSAEAEHKVLQHVMEGLISFSFKHEDLQCSLFRYIVREILACAVMRPVLNLTTPRFINERIESLANSLSKADKGSSTVPPTSQPKANESPKLPPNHFSRLLDPSVKGVELVQFKKDKSDSTESLVAQDVNGTLHQKDPLLSVDPRSTRSWGSLPSDTGNGDGRGIQRHSSGGDWGDMLDLMSRRKTEALAPEHFENMWAKGRNYKAKEGTNRSTEHGGQIHSTGSNKTVDSSKVLGRPKEKGGTTKGITPESSVYLSKCSEQSVKGNMHVQGDLSRLIHFPANPYEEHDNYDVTHLDEDESGSTSSHPTEDEEGNNVTGLDSPGIKVWDGKNNRNLSVSRIHHPLESSKGLKTRKTGKGHIQSERMPRTHSMRKRSRLSNQKVQVWQEVERTSFLLGDGQDILNASKGHVKSEDSSGDSDSELMGRIYSGATASSSSSSISMPESNYLALTGPKNSLLADAFLKLKCEVLGANIVKSGSKTFAVYSISVTDINNNSWSIKRRFRHFEELHRRLKEFTEYNLHLPPKHFLSTGLDVPVIQERCRLLDKYLKRLLQLPTISGSIEVWDFLSVDSQAYSFSNSISIIETLSVDLGSAAPCGKTTVAGNVIGHVGDPLSSRRELSNAGSKESSSQMKPNSMVDGSRLNTKKVAGSPPRRASKNSGKTYEDSDNDSENVVQKNSLPVRNLEHPVKEPDSLMNDADPIPSEWVPPNLSIPILDLVDVIFQLQDGGWIRRKAFWVAKQVLQLGMGDAFDDWLIEKIQLLRKGSVVASGIRRLEQILWPDGIFITKHPKRQRPTPAASPSHDSPHGQPPPPLSPKNEEIWKVEELQQREAQRRAKFVYELMIDNAPAAIVGLFGRKEYEQCAKDLYYYIQSSVCLKQLSFDLLELLLLSAFPELDDVFRQLHEEKEKFGEFKAN